MLANTVLTVGGVLVAAGVIGWIVAAVVNRGAAANPRGRGPQPGEIWWATVPYRDGEGEKRRPALVLAGDGRSYTILKITSQDKSQRRDHLEIPTRTWDRRATYNSYLDLSAPFQLNRLDFANRAGVVDPATWQRVAQAHRVGMPVPAGRASLPSGRLVTWLSTLAFVLGVLAVCAGSALIPWMNRIRHEMEVAASADVPLHDATVSASDQSGSGRAYDSTLNGVHFVDSTGFWVGCEGKPSAVTFALDGNFKRFTGTAGLDAVAPKDIVVKLVVEVDGKDAATVSVSRTASAPLDVDITSARTLTLSAQRTKGTCANATRPYGAVGDALLHKT
ncbi:NPCBM/NEW2 domain-containing protein [Dactylosporangium sp. NBC_01737]|uniref:NPCBM/NEW2 domain-containing protein n=1 Tax=Dactylosporangium sp. NBC_01737 TaxID=2975959 RepID=UPI002E0DC524|nr:NPCBM/NEW2 domain-containing protein [Dactylosporangium sp. NBC_01737]